MISRHYVQKLNDAGVKGWGLQYATAQQSAESNELSDCYHIEGDQGDGGRWYLLIDRSEFVSDDLPYLEMLLRLWILEEGIHYEEAGGPVAADYGFMAPGYSFGWIIADNGPNPWDDEYGQPVDGRLYGDDETCAVRRLNAMNTDSMKYHLMPVAWLPGEDEFVCCSISPTRIQMPACLDAKRRCTND